MKKQWIVEVQECLKTLDGILANNQFLCGGQLTLADIVVYNELSQFLELCGEKRDGNEM